MTPWGYRATAFVLFRQLSVALRGVVNALIFNLIYIFISFISFLPLISLIICVHPCYLWAVSFSSPTDFTDYH